MEFYKGANILEYLAFGFNSQRDGILRIFIFKIHYYIVVSIPNGMEFYNVSMAQIQYSYFGFNSQRDGILHWVHRLQ